jgi:hypothetical protein
LKNLSLIAGGIASLALGTVLATQSHAADHLDSASLAGNSMGDINDVYAWMTTDTAKVNLAMTVSPGDDGTHSFSDAVQYVFHVASRTGDPLAVIGHPGMGTETKVICTFASNTSVQCWVVVGTTVKDYVTGNPTATGGITSGSGKTRVFAGRRSDPFFFNLQGFRNAVAAIAGMAGSLAPDAAGCPTGLIDAQVMGVRGILSTLQTTGTGSPPCSTTEIDCFKTFNVMAIVVQVDKTLLNQPGNTILAVWGSTHAKP